MQPPKSLLAGHRTTTASDETAPLEPLPLDASGVWPFGASTPPAIVQHSIDHTGVRDAPARVWPNPATLDHAVRLLAHAPVGAALLTTDGTLLLSNPALDQLMGAPFPGYNLRDDPQARATGLVELFNRAAHGESSTTPTQWVTPRATAVGRSDKRVAIAVNFFPVMGAAGVEYVCALYHDDTQAMTAQHQLRAMSEQLEQHVLDRTSELAAANEELEAFSYSVSHDLRAPLRAIDAFAALLDQDADSRLSATATDHVRRIRSAASRMSELINDLLAFAKLGKQALSVKTVAPLHLVHQVLTELEPKLRDRAVKIHVGKLPECRADAALLREVFLNLLDNAIKFTATREHARIEVGATIQHERVVYFVNDNGVGFNMDHYERLFGVFSRLHSMDEFEGTGVGLALVQRIVKRHGGDVWANAEPDAGATFYFALSNV